MWGKGTVKKLQAPCYHVLRKGVLRSTALTTTLSTISTSASTSTNFTGRRSMIRRQWAAKCSSLKGKIPETHKTSSASTASSSNSVPQGWALKARKCSRFTEKVKNFLLELFLLGEETGRKVTPPDPSRRVRTLCREGTNQRLFDEEEWLTAQQIASYFSSLATLKKTWKLPQASDINLGDQDLEPLEREILRYNLRERVKHKLTLWTHFKLLNREPSHAGFSGRRCLQFGPSTHTPFCAEVPPFSLKKPAEW